MLCNLGLASRRHLSILLSKKVHGLIPLPLVNHPENKVVGQDAYIPYNPPDWKLVILLLGAYVVLASLFLLASFISSSFLCLRFVSHFLGFFRLFLLMLNCIHCKVASAASLRKWFFCSVSQAMLSSASCLGERLVWNVSPGASLRQCPLREDLFGNICSETFLRHHFFCKCISAESLRQHLLEDIWRSFHQLVDKRKRVGLGEGSEVGDKRPDFVGRRMRFLLLLVLHTCWYLVGFPVLKKEPLRKSVDENLRRLHRVCRTLVRVKCLWTRCFQFSLSLLSHYQFFESISCLFIIFAIPILKHKSCRKIRNRSSESSASCLLVFQKYSERLLL